MLDFVLIEKFISPRSIMTINQTIPKTSLNMREGRCTNSGINSPSFPLYLLRNCWGLNTIRDHHFPPSIFNLQRWWWWLKIYLKLNHKRNHKLIWTLAEHAKGKKKWTKVIELLKVSFFASMANTKFCCEGLARKNEIKWKLANC